VGWGLRECKFWGTERTGKNKIKDICWVNINNSTVKLEPTCPGKKKKKKLYYRGPKEKAHIKLDISNTNRETL